MADVRIARYDAATGWLPPVCPKHGVQADRRVTKKFSTPTPPWVWLLILLSLLIAVIVAACIQKSDQVLLPACRACDEGRLRRRQIRWGLGLTSIATLFVGVAMDSGGLVALACLLVLCWVFAMSSLLDGLETVTGSLDGPWLNLKGVHPAFVAALRPNPAWAQPVPQQWAAPGVHQVRAAAAWPQHRF